MNEDQHRRHSVRRIVLPSGRSVEVVRFDDEPYAPVTAGLHVCPECSSRLVQPVAWGEATEERCELTLHCPNCDWSDHGVYDQEQVTLLEEQLDEGVTAILEDLKRLTTANMAAEIDRFRAALEADLILPEDF